MVRRNVALTLLLTLTSPILALYLPEPKHDTSALRARDFFNRPYAPFSAASVVPPNSPAYSLWYQSSTTAGQITPETTYTCYGGDPFQNYPQSANGWLNFEALWEINVGNVRAFESDEQIVQTLRWAILVASEMTRVDARLILAMVMQESTGNIHVAPDASGHCGLLQPAPPCSSYASILAADPAATPFSAILTMLLEGLQGTAGGYPGLAQALVTGCWQGDPYPGNPYAAARIYNSGSIAIDGGSNGMGFGVLDRSVAPGDTAAYVNDVANRLVGWDGAVDGCRISALVCRLRDVGECT